MVEDTWDWVQEELKKIQEEVPVDSDMMQVVDAISVADFWKRRYDEELMLWERKLEVKEDEKKHLQDKAQEHEMAIKELDWKLKELDNKWQQEKSLLEDRLKTKEVESALEKARLQLEAKIKALEEENKSLKGNISVREGVAVAPPDGMIFPAGMRSHTAREMREAEERDEESKKRLYKLEEEKKDVAEVLKVKEKEFSEEREKWKSLQEEVKTLGSQMSQQLKNLKNREEEHFSILEDLARGFAHRVRNYLGIISGTVQLCISGYKMETELEDQLKVVDENVQDMLKSIEEFLSLARVPEMSIHPLDLNGVLDNAYNSLEKKTLSQNISVTKNLDPNIPKINGDVKLINEAFVYLIQNSLEAMPSGGKLNFVSNYNNITNQITVKIIDTGSGISENHLKKVFQPYFSSKKNHKGLGLTAAKRVIDLHRGTLTLESEKNKGTTTVITLNSKVFTKQSEDNSNRT